MAEGDRFEIGEVAIFDRPGTAGHGDEVTIIGPLESRQAFDHVIAKVIYEPSYLVEAPWFNASAYGGKYAVCPPRYLRKKKPPNDTNNVVSWDDVGVWRPMKELA